MVSWRPRPHDEAYEAGDDPDPDDHDADQEPGEAGDGQHHGGRGQTRAAADGGQDGQQQDGDQILDDQDAEHDVGAASGHALLGERLDDDGGAGDRDDGAGE